MEKSYLLTTVLCNVSYYKDLFCVFKQQPPSKQKKPKQQQQTQRSGIKDIWLQLIK